jgi:hypothetical protein
MLRKRPLLPAVLLAALTSTVVAAGSVRLASDALHRLEHDSGVPWVALSDGPSSGTGYHLNPTRRSMPWLAAGEDPTHGAMRFFAAYGAIFQMVDPAHELKVYARGGGQGAQAAFFTQVEAGVPVVDTGMSIEFDGDGRIETITGSFLPHLHGFRASHALSPASARALARLDMARRFPAVHHPTYEDSGAPELCIALVGHRPRLAYRLTVDYAQTSPTMHYVVDASTGAILSATPGAP